MKTISKLFTLLLLVAISISYVSCGGDDNETIINPNEQPNNNGNNNNNNNNNNDDTEEVSIVGTWKYVFDNYEGKESYCLMILEPNGEGYLFEEDWSWTDEYDIAERYAEKITYKYAFSELTIYYEEGDNEVINVEFLNNDVIETDFDGEEDVWKRQKHTYDNISIIGNWQCDYWEWSNQYNEYINYFEGLQFNPDGSGYSYEYEYYGIEKSYFAYEYNAPILTIDEEYDASIKFISNNIFLLDSEDSEIKVYVKNAIVGTWRDDWGSGAGSYTAYSFFEDGTGLYFDKGNGARRFTYIYNQQLQVINTNYIVSGSEEQITISKITSNELVIEGDEYKKTDLTHSMLILGEWMLHVNVESEEEHKTIVDFNYDGTYEAQDYRGWYYGNSMGDLIGTYTGTYNIAGNKIFITGQSQIAGEYIIEGLVANGCRLVRASNPDEYPYLFGGFYER